MICYNIRPTYKVGDDMKKLFAVIIFAGAVFFGITYFELFAHTTYVNEEQVLALVTEGTVVVSEGHIHNLAYMQEFYQNVSLNIDGEVHLILDPYTGHSREYVLQFVDEQILLVSVTDSDQGVAGEYVRLFRIFRDQEIHYVLACADDHEYVLFGHRAG